PSRCSRAAIGSAIATAAFLRSIEERRKETPKITPRITARFLNSQRVAFTNAPLACPPSHRRRFGASAVARALRSRAEVEKARAPPLTRHDERAAGERSFTGIVAR